MKEIQMLHIYLIQKKAVREGQRSKTDMRHRKKGKHKCTVSNNIRLY